MVAAMEKLKASFGVGYVALAAEACVGYRRLMRWRRRIGKGEPPLKVPGPKKTTPFDLRRLHQNIDRLHHGRKRSRGSKTLHRAHGEALSRREIDALVRMARKAHNGHRAAGVNRVRWHVPNLAWALDGSEYRSRFVTGKLHMQNLQDLYSRYKFAPLTTDYLPCGEEVSGYLADQFNRFAPPLFLKARQWRQFESSGGRCIV
jgi:hypothetical protein